MNVDEHLDTARKLVSKGLFHAAIDLLYQCERMNEKNDLEINGELYDELGKLKIRVADYHQAVEWFSKAISCAQNKDSWIKYNVHLSVAYKRLSEFDTCYRYLSHLHSFAHEMSEETKVLYMGNLSAINGISGFYERVIAGLLENLEMFSRMGIPGYDVAIYNNLGLAYLESRSFEQAEYYLRKSAERGGDTYIEPIVELGNLFMIQGRLSESIQYARQAMDLVWASIIRYEKEDIARLCNLLANIAIRLQEKDLALRLNEKAQVFFGQLGLWRKWQDIDSELGDWQSNGVKKVQYLNVPEVPLQEVRNFLGYLEAVNAQELIDKRISKLLDMRVHYMKLFATYLNLSQKDSDELVLASRFADYGLTALESEVALDPTRSEEAFKQFKQHPALSVAMLKVLNLPSAILSIITDHHENYDGTGFPNEKIGEDINNYARIFAVADYYARGVSLEEKSHREVMGEIARQSGREFDPQIVKSFQDMFKR